MTTTPEQVASMIERADSWLQSELGWAFRYPTDPRRTEIVSHWATVSLALRARLADMRCHTGEGEPR